MGVIVHGNRGAVPGFLEHPQHFRHDFHKPVVDAEQVIVAVSLPDPLMAPLNVPADLPGAFDIRLKMALSVRR